MDIWGVRRVSLMALSVALVGRTLLAFGRSTTILYVALFVFSPCGDALLSVGLYRVALKKLTTPRTRPLAFGLSYAFQNASGAVVALVVDRMRRRLDDVHVNIGSGDGGKYVMVAAVEGVYTPVRQFIVSVEMYQEMISLSLVTLSMLSLEFNLKHTCAFLIS